MKTDSLFYDISAERIARLRSIRVGGRQLFDENGEVTQGGSERDAVRKSRARLENDRVAGSSLIST